MRNRKRHCGNYGDTNAKIGFFEWGGGVGEEEKKKKKY